MLLMNSAIIGGESDNGRLEVGALLYMIPS